MVGEASGDLHGAKLVRALSELRSDFTFFGVGGPRLRDAGVTIYYDISQLNTVGLVEVFGKAFSIYRIYRDLKRRLETEGFSLAIFIDYPTVNLRLGRLARKKGIMPVYYIGPQLWAGRTPWRVWNIRRTFTKVLAIFPFEEALYREKGIAAEFVSHPLLEVVRPSLSREKALAQFGLEDFYPIIGLLPGSRQSEIELLLSPILRAVWLIRQGLPKAQFVLALADTVARDKVEEIIAQEEISVTMVERHTYDVMNVADLLLVASGTATLEAGLLAKPMVILYKFHPFTWLLAKVFKKAPYLGLVNHLAGREIVPELEQYRVTPAEIARLSLNILQSPERYQTMVEELRAIRPMLGTSGAAQRAARSIVACLEATEG